MLDLEGFFLPSMWIYVGIKSSNILEKHVSPFW